MSSRADGLAGTDGPFAVDPLDRSAVAAIALVTLFTVALATAQLTAAKVIALPLPVALPVVGPEITLPGAALAYALATLHGFTGGAAELSTIARQGSGSACRSLAGGFVAWDMGQKSDGSDSKARQVAPASHWPELQVLILVVSDTKKAVSSTAGMQNSVDTSPLLAHRAAKIVPERMEQMEAALQIVTSPSSFDSTASLCTRCGEHKESSAHCTQQLTRTLRRARQEQVVGALGRLGQGWPPDDGSQHHRALPTRGFF